jgi:hypothetical protein
VSRKDKHRDLARDEVWVPPLHELPDGWARDNAYVDYRILKLAGPWAVLYALGMALGLLLAILGQQQLAIVALVADQAVFVVVLAVAYARVREMRRLQREDQREREG